MTAGPETPGSTQALVDRWRPESWTAFLRRNGPGEVPPLERWERVLRGERSIRYLLAVAMARFPVLRRLLRLPAQLATTRGVTLEEREACVQALRAAGASSRVSPGAMSAGGTAPPHDTDSRPPGMPAIEPAVSDEIERALEMLRQVPFEEIQRRGWHLQPNHYYWPLNDVPFLRANPDLWLPARVPADIDWDLDAQEGLLRRLAVYAEELDDVPDDPPSGNPSFAWGNPTLPRGDAVAYYGLVRELRPRHVVEIGSGWSTLLLSRAIARNPEPSQVTLVEPDPPPWLERTVPTDWHFEPTIVQRARMEVFEQLTAGDVLFYDGSHCVRAGSDVNWFFFEILPRVAEGVWIHVHDIRWPHDRMWGIVDDGLTWNEQYFVQAFLMGNRQYRVRLAMNMLSVLRNDKVAEFAPGPNFTGGSLWFEKVG